MRFSGVAEICSARENSLEAIILCKNSWHYGKSG
nr:MAG TPA: hypothetical protein [Caudoviricetes sp.]